MNVLVTGVGAIIGYGIIEAIRKTDKKVKIYATDIYGENYGKYKCDRFYKVPYTSDPNYENVIRDIIESNNIDIVFPGIEQDVFYFNKNYTKFNTKIVLNSSELVDLCYDKLSFFKYLELKGYKDLIPTYQNLDFESAKSLLGLPFIIKPKTSYASKGFHIINKKEDFLYLENEINADTLFQPYVGSDDHEYTISVFGDGEGSFLDSIIMRRYLSAAGASEKTYVVKEDKDLMISVEELVSLFCPLGPTNFQFRKSGSKVHLLEINPRISSTCSVRSKFGYNEPLYCLEYFVEKKSITKGEKRFGKAIRYISDEIIYE